MAIKDKRGKKFICWLTGRYYNDTALYQGDSVLYHIKKRWWKGIIRKHNGWYYIHIEKRKFCVLFIFHLKPITE